MARAHLVGSVLVCVAAIQAAAWGQVTPTEAVTRAVGSSSAFTAGTTVTGVKVTDGAVEVDLSEEAAPPGLGDSEAEAMTQAIADGLAAWPAIGAIEIKVAGRPLWQYLSRASEVASSPAAKSRAMAAAPAPAATTELAGKLVVLHPSHGSYWDQSVSYWRRAMRTLCGPNPATSIPPGWTGSTYQPSDYYYWTKGYQWGSFYEDDMSPETIRFLYKYVESSGAEVWVSRNLDKNAGNFDYAGYGYPNCSFPLPKWQTAAKYYLQDRGDVPATVYNTTDVTGETNKDIRARPYYANYRMAQKYAGQDQSDQSVWGNCVSLSLHSNAAGSGTARGTESYWYTSIYTYLQTESTRFAGAINTGIVSAVRNEYDGFWANTMYPTGTTPTEWPSGTYYGYSHAGTSTTWWQNRGVKTQDFGEIREAMMPATLCELAFHDDWKFYPDHVFMMDQIFRATVAWGMYEGICGQFYVTPKPRLGATVVSVDFPAVVAPNQTVSGTITMQNDGMAWCWGNKFDTATTQYGPYTVWKLKATASDQFAPGTKIALTQNAIVYPGGTTTFSVSLTAPAATGTYTTEWRMVKDDARGGDFGGTATAQIRVEATTAPAVTSIAPSQGSRTGSVSITNLAGTGFASGATVKLTKSGQTDIAATSVDVVSATRITCTFNLVGADLGAWNVVVTNPDAQWGKLDNGFTVLPRLFENFDSYANQAAMQVVWPPLFDDGSSMALLQGFACVSDSQGLHGVATTDYTMRNYRYLDNWTAYVGSDAQPMVFQFWARDPDTANENSANFIEVRAHSGDGFPTAPPYPAGSLPPFNTTLQSLVAMGTWPTPAPANRWHVRVIGGGLGAWYALNTPRESNRWTKLTAKVYGSKIEFYVDDALDTTLSMTGPLSPMDAVLLGSGRVSNGDDVAFDDVLLTVGTPPGVTAITPRGGSSGGTANITSLVGTGFVDGTSVKITKLGQPAIAGGDVSVASPTQIACTLDLAGAPAGWRDVVVATPDGLLSMLGNGFYVCSGSSALGDFDQDCDVDGADLSSLQACVSGASVPYESSCSGKNLDGDADVDMDDFGVFQRCYSGANAIADLNCRN